MGLKISSNCNAIPASFENGKLYFDIGATGYSIPVPAISTLKWCKQCNQFQCDNVLAYLIGEEYSLILRRDGTGCVFTTKERILCKNFMYKAPSFSKYYVSKGGSYRDTRTNAYSIVELYSDDHDGYILSIVGVPVSATFNACDNPKYMLDIKRYSSDGFPELKMFDNDLYAIDHNGKINYKVNCSLSQSNGFILL